MKLEKVLILGLFVMLINACQNTVISTDNNNEITSYKVDNAKKVNDYYPLEKGRSWTYQLHQFQNDQPNDKFKEMTIQITDNNRQNGFDTAVMKRIYPDSSIQPNQTLAKIYSDHIELSRYIQQSVFLSFGIPQTRTNDSITILTEPLTKGSNWEGRTFQGGTEKITIQGEESVTVPAGTFKAIKVNHHLAYDNGKEDNLYYWYADKIGTVKMHEEITFYTGGEWLKMKSIGELKSFSK